MVQCCYRLKTGFGLHSWHCNVLVYGECCYMLGYGAMLLSSEDSFWVAFMTMQCIRSWWNAAIYWFMVLSYRSVGQCCYLLKIAFEHYSWQCNVLVHGEMLLYIGICAMLLSSEESFVWYPWQMQCFGLCLNAAIYRCMVQHGAMLLSSEESFGWYPWQMQCFGVW